MLVAPLCAVHGAVHERFHNTEGREHGAARMKKEAVVWYVMAGEGERADKKGGTFVGSEHNQGSSTAAFAHTRDTRLLLRVRIGYRWTRATNSAPPGAGSYHV